MTMLFMDGFDHYGPGAVGIGNMLDGPYASVAGEGPVVPTWGVARTGQYCFEQGDTGGGFRRVLPAAISTVLVGMGYAVDALPGSNNITGPITWSNDNNETIARLALQSTGVLALLDTNSAVVAQTAAPVIVPQNWHFLECELTTTAGSGAFRLDVDGNTLINVSGLTLPAPASPDASRVISQITWGFKNGSTAAVQYFDDLTVRDTNGTYNNSFEGDLRVATLFPDADGPNQGWTPEYLHNIGNGVLSLLAGSNANPACVTSGSSTTTDLGTGDFTLEGFVRFNTLPTGGNKSQIFGKWDETDNRRSWQLYLGGPTLEAGNLVFRTSTDGTAATVEENISFPWPNAAPDLFTWYHLAIVRSSGELLLFIDGVQYGLPQADTRTYFVGVEPLALGAQVEGSTNVIANTWANAWMDEVRFTVGFARYTANFTPTTVPFPRNSSGDPEFADVVLLMGFDSGIADESGYARTVVGRGGAAAITPNDGTAAYETINHPTPEDDTFIQAALTPATQTLTLAQNPAPNDTVTVGTYTNAGSHAAVYTFVAALTAAFQVLIGANEGATLANLIAAINLTGGAGVTYGTGTIVNDDVTAAGLPSPQMLVAANTAGTGGNAIASTSSLTGGGGWGAATLQGGANIPGNSDFFFQRPPNGTTIIKAVEVVNRSYKSDAGAAQVQASLIGPLGTVSAGAANNLTVSPTYRQDIFETDPDTGGTITPSTIVGGRVRIDRTE